MTKSLEDIQLFPDMKYRMFGQAVKLQSRAIAPSRFVTSQILAPPKYNMQQFSMYYTPIDMGNILVPGILKKRVYFPAYINTYSS